LDDEPEPGVEELFFDVSCLCFMLRSRDGLAAGHVVMRFLGCVAALFYQPEGEED